MCKTYIFIGLGGLGDTFLLGCTGVPLTSMYSGLNLSGRESGRKYMKQVLMMTRAYDCFLVSIE